MKHIVKINNFNSDFHLNNSHVPRPTGLPCIGL